MYIASDGDAWREPSDAPVAAAASTPTTAFQPAQSANPPPSALPFGQMHASPVTPIIAAPPGSSSASSSSAGSSSAASSSAASSRPALSSWLALASCQPHSQDARERDRWRRRRSATCCSRTTNESARPLAPTLGRGSAPGAPRWWRQRRRHNRRRQETLAWAGQGSRARVSRTSTISDCDA